MTTAPPVHALISSRRRMTNGAGTLLLGPPLLPPAPSAPASVRLERAFLTHRGARTHSGVAQFDADLARCLCSLPSALTSGDPPAQQLPPDSLLSQKHSEPHHPAGLLSWTLSYHAIVTAPRPHTPASTNQPTLPPIRPYDHTTRLAAARRCLCYTNTPIVPAVTAFEKQQQTSEHPRTTVPNIDRLLPPLVLALYSAAQQPSMPPPSQR